MYTTKGKREKKQRALTHIPEYHVNVQHEALLHVAAVVHPGVQSERIFAFVEPVNRDGLLAILRKLHLSRGFPANFLVEEDVSDIVPRKRAEALLRGMGRSGWKTLEGRIKRNTEYLV